MYDFPRSHQVETMESIRSTLARRHCYNNAAPGNIEGQIFRYDISPKPGTSSSQMFQYDIDETHDEPASPLSQSSSCVLYSNLPSPTDAQQMPPPVVNRGLKPKRKLSDTLSVSSSIEPPSPRLAPSVDRKLKPTNFQVYNLRSFKRALVKIYNFVEVAQWEINGRNKITKKKRININRESSDYTQIT